VGVSTLGGFNRAHFQPAYDVEVAPEFPSHGEWRLPVFGFDGESSVQSEFALRSGSPCIVRVSPRSSGEWIGMFARGGLGGVTAVCATPSPSRLCVIVDGDAYLVNVDAPGDGADVVCSTVEHVAASSEPSFLLFVTGIDMVALGPSGVAWRSPRLAVDDLRVVDVDERGIHCTADLLAGDLVALVASAYNGEVIAGPRLDGPPWNP
jgi:hypothetical protein